jgi:hypothetical protein
MRATRPANLILLDMIGLGFDMSLFSQDNTSCVEEPIVFLLQLIRTRIYVFRLSAPFHIYLC